jgi:hypothetical protein
VLKGRAYAIGGKLGSGQYTNLVEIYDPARDEWIAGPPLPSARGSCAAATVADNIYVVGGNNDSGTLATVERLDASLGTSLHSAQSLAGA